MAAPNSYFASSPVVLPPNPNQTAQYFASSHYAEPVNNSAPANGTSNPFAQTPTGSIPPTPGSLAGRKRSRGDINDPDEEEQSEDGALPTPIEEEPRGRPVYGPGMTVIYPDDPGYAAAAASQSGTWVEGQAERKPFQIAHMKRPSVSSRKSMRKDTCTAGPDDLAQLVLPDGMREATQEPLINEATRVLGISWTRMDATEALQINQAAYSKWIQNHYPSLTAVAVWFENSALPGYLVESRNVYSGQQAFHIFSHDLMEARLVTTEPAQLVPRLKLLPALHLAAPGGHIVAETDAVAAAQHEASVVQETMAAANPDPSQFSKEVSELRGQIQDHAYPTPESAASQADGMCSAHEMELD